ncbi:MAG: ATP synthase F1 subunit epsilon [Clostridiales bacterium]|nr:ATP synthase F1 subunit epsilon [Clostridiales bacterium]
MINSLTAPASLGSMGVLHDHAPLLTTLDTGILCYTKANQASQLIAVASGLMEVNNNHVLVLVQAAEKAEDIDLERANAALTRAKERLASHKSEIDVHRAEASVSRAMNRIRIVK